MSTQGKALPPPPPPPTKKKELPPPPAGGSKSSPKHPPTKGPLIDDGANASAKNSKANGDSPVTKTQNDSHANSPHENQNGNPSSDERRGNFQGIRGISAAALEEIKKKPLPPPPPRAASQTEIQPRTQRSNTSHGKNSPKDNAASPGSAHRPKSTMLDPLTGMIRIFELDARLPMKDGGSRLCDFGAKNLVCISMLC